MMAHRGVYTLLLGVLLTWTTFSISTPRIHPSIARIKVKRENAEFVSFNTSGGNMTDNLKLVHDPDSVKVYAGGPHGLYFLNPKGLPALEQVCVLIKFESDDHSPDCTYTITLLKEGRNGHPLFMCGTENEITQCCDVTSEHRAANCFTLRHEMDINEPSMHVGDSLYYTVSNGHPKGLYRSTMGKETWPNPSQSEQRHVKILASQGNGQLDGKVYIFYIEQNPDQNPEPDTPLWIAKVSQICMADQGGSKAVLQFRWTSMLTAYLFCGDETKHLSYTELLDVAVLEAAEWNNFTIYALFKNAYNLRAVCVYRMSDIVRVFTSNELKNDIETLTSRPGECVKDSRLLPPSILQFMGNRPEMKQWIKPARDPLLFNHHHYTHLLVDRVISGESGNSHYNVLLMSLENGRIHKILDEDGERGPFIIAEYEAFKSRTHISSMLLDRATKQLFVSSSSEVITIDLHDCGVYKEDCASCVSARDPYCSWDSVQGKCSANTKPARSLIQDVTHGNQSICENGVLKTSKFKDPSTSIHQFSKFYLKCPIESQHALYFWEHRGRRRECVSTEQDCLLLIDSMSEKDKGAYKCIASENGYDRTIVRQVLQMNAAAETGATRVALACLLSLIYSIC